MNVRQQNFVIAIVLMMLAAYFAYQKEAVHAGLCITAVVTLRRSNGKGDKT